ncbi:MAG: hypothetical protein RLZZ350_2650, partial [Verrucomicrobiota bacterium]
RSTSSGQSYGVIWQNNPLGYFNCSIPLNNGRQANQNNGLVQAGPGTVVYNANNSYELATYLNGGCSLITSYASFGQTNNGYTTVSPVNLNGGTVVGNATFTHDQSGVNARQFILGNNGGGLAATAGNTMTVDGFVTDAAGAGALTIGIAASAANNFTANLLPGSGTGTANPTPVLATGMVALTAPNSHTGGTVLQGGTLNINGIFALGGANYGGLTFNGGTLQYAANFPGTNGSSDLTSIGNAGITFAAGTDTIDLNGNAVTYAGSIGNGGSGALVVKSSLANGSLNLQGANTYFGNTTVTNATLAANNASGSATGFGNVLVQNSGVLTGAGGVDGSVTVASGGALAPGAFNAFDLGGDLTLAAGSTTTLAVQRSPATSATVNVTGLVTEGGALVVTNVGATNFTAGDHFQLFSATSFAGAFASTNLPTLPDASVRWSTTRLNTDGSLWVVSTAPVSSPQIALVTNNLVFSANSGTPGWDYYLITTTNLALPTAAWERAVTNQFDGAGNLNLSLPLDPASPRRFYRLLVP